MILMVYRKQSHFDHDFSFSICDILSKLANDYSFRM